MNQKPYSVDSMRSVAKRRLPRMLFDFIDGGSDDEITRSRNVSRFDDIEFAPRVLRRTPDLDLSTEVLGQKLSMPVVVAPTGLSGLMWPSGEMAVAKACAEAGVIMTVSHATTVAMEALAQASTNPIWFQTLIYKDRGMTRDFADRAKQSGYSALVLTVDLQALGQRERDIRNHFTIPPRISLKNVFDAVSHPGWLYQYLSQPQITMTGYAGDGMTDLGTLAQHMATLFESNVGWDDVEWLRAHWDGPLILKGILHPEDARQAARLGVDAVVVSNHGGRQLDTAPAPIDVLPAVVDQVAGDMEVLMCSGIRRGTHVVKALALGASAVMIGRAHLWGLAASGQPGVTEVLNILSAEMKRTLALGGWNSVADIDRAALCSQSIPSTLS